MRDLLLAVPSRGRPGNIARLHDAMTATCRADTVLVVGLDEDDPCLPEYLWYQNEQGWAAVIRPGLRSVVPWINAIAVPRARYYRAIGHIGDDNVPMTDGWDVRIMSALEHSPFAFCNDLYPRPPGSLSCHVFMQSEVTQRLGYFSPPEPVHMYTDVIWMAWGTATRIIYLHDVVIEHRHFTTGKAPFDESYGLSNSRIPADLDAYHAYCRDRLNADLLKISPDARLFTPEMMHQFNVNLNIPPRWGEPVR